MPRLPWPPLRRELVRPAGTPSAAATARSEPDRTPAAPRPVARFRGRIPARHAGRRAPAGARTSDQDAYFRLFALAMEAVLTLAVWLAVGTADRLRAAAGDGALAQATLLTLALGVIAVRRYDPTVALAIAAAVHGLAPAVRPERRIARRGGRAQGRPHPARADLCDVCVAPGNPRQVPFPSSLGKSLPPGEDPGVREAPDGVRPASAQSKGSRGHFRKLAASASCFPYPIRRLRQHLPRFAEKGVAGAARLGRTRAVPSSAFSSASRARSSQQASSTPQSPTRARSTPSPITDAPDPGRDDLQRAPHSGAPARSRDHGQDFGYGSLNVLSPAEPALRTLSMVLLLAGVLSSWAFAWTRLGPPATSARGSSPSSGRASPASWPSSRSEKCSARNIACGSFPSRPSPRRSSPPGPPPPRLRLPHGPGRVPVPVRLPLLDAGPRRRRR